MKNFIVLSVLAFLSIFIFCGPSALGQESETGSLKQIPAEEFKKIVDHDRIIAQRWWYGWIAGYSAATAVQGVVFLSTDERATRQDMIVGGATTFLGAVAALVTPIVPPRSSWRKYNIQANDTSRISYENLLKEIARREKEGRSWKMHVITGVVNAGSGLITWLGFDRSIGAGLVNFAINTIVTEAQIWTQPVKAIKDYRKYCGDNLLKAEAEIIKPDRKLYFGGGPSGFVLRYVF